MDISIMFTHIQKGMMGNKVNLEYNSRSDYQTVEELKEGHNLTVTQNIVLGEGEPHERSYKIFVDVEVVSIDAENKTVIADIDYQRYKVREDQSLNFCFEPTFELRHINDLTTKQRGNTDEDK